MGIVDACDNILMYKMRAKKRFNYEICWAGEAKRNVEEPPEHCGKCMTEIIAC